MKHLFLFMLFFGATDIFGQHVAASLHIARNPRTFSTLSSVRRAMLSDSQQDQKEQKFKQFDTNDNILPKRNFLLPSLGLAIYPAAFSAFPITFVGLLSDLDGSIMYQGTSVVWALSALCIYKFKVESDNCYRQALKAHNGLAHRGSQVLQESFEHPFIKEVLPFRVCPDLKSSFERYVERSNISPEDAYKELEAVHQKLTAVISADRNIIYDSQGREVIDKIKAMTDDLTFVLANVVPDNGFNNRRKMKYAYMVAPEYTINRVEYRKE